jgi:hypothetical protein
MSYYNLYYINGRMGYLDRSDAFDAMNDEEAVGIATRRAGSQPLELWCGGRLVQRFAGSSPAVASTEAAA